MRERTNDMDMSQLEQEFELEMKDLADGGSRYGDEREQDEEFEGGDIEQEFEMLFESDDPGADPEFEREDGGGLTPYAERLYELAQDHYESEAEVDEKINGLLTEMEYEYFWNPIKSIKKAAKGFAKSALRGPLSGLIQKGLRLAGKNIPIFQALEGVTKLARGDVRGMLGNLIKAGLGSAIPGAGPFLPAILSSIGFTGGENPAENREAWNNIDAAAREAYEYLAENLTEEIDNPLEASRQASAAFQNGLRRVQHSLPAGGWQAGSRYARDHRQNRNVRVITVHPGEEILIRVRRA